MPERTPQVAAVDPVRLKAWVDAVRTRTTIEVADDATSLDAAARSTIPDTKRPGAVVFPDTVEDVRVLVQLANEFRVPLWPVSGGRNWGYGSATPAIDNTVVLRLERLNRIIEVHEELAFAVIEPGVTYRQLKDHLVHTGSRLWMDCTDGPPDGSVIGNALERGMGVTHYADHFASLCGLEVVLPDGTLIRTGGGDNLRCPTWNTHKWGVGPYLEGLFSQSNYGIVVKAGVWLFPAPQSYCAFTFDLARVEDLPRLVDVVRELMLAGVLPAGVHVVNDVCALSVIAQYPPDPSSAEIRRLPNELLAKELHRHGVKSWSFGGSIHGTRAWQGVVRGELRRQLTRYGRLTFITERSLAAATLAEGFIDKLPRGTAARRWLEKAFRRVSGKSVEMIPVARKIHRLMRGEPSDFFVRHAYFRSRTPKPTHADPDRDNVGVIWLAPVVPMQGRYVEAVLHRFRQLFEAHGFDFYVALLAQNSRTLIVLLCIFYDRQDAGETARAKKLYAALSEDMLAQGLQPYRTGVGAATGYPQVYDDLLAALKDSLDPNAVLAPGKSRIRNRRSTTSEAGR